MVRLVELRPHPRNPNRHAEAQIRRLADILEYQGFRYPIKVSRLSGYITSGHGRLQAAQMLGMDSVPVNFQDYESEAQEYADVVSDNSIALWAELDLAAINAELPDLGPDFDINLLGLKDFALDVADRINEINRGDENAEWVDMPEFVAGENYIKLIFIFGSEAERKEYCEKNGIQITMTKSNQWIVHRKPRD